MKLVIAKVGFGVIAALSLVPAVQADDADVLDHRKHIMDALSAESAILGQIVSGAIPNDDVVKHLDAFALIASTALKSFEAKVPGGGSKPNVWTEWPDFSKRMKEFADMAEKSAKLGHTDSPEAGLTSMLEAMSCKDCHDKYRVEKKK